MARKSKPITTITYRDVRRIVIEYDEVMLAAVDGLITAVLVLSPAALGLGAIPLLGVFDLKSDVVRRIGNLAARLAGRHGGFLARSESLAAGHLLITYTAFWAAAGEELGPLLADRELTTGQRAAAMAEAHRIADPDGTGDDTYAGLPPVSLPHPGAGFRDEDQQRLQMYREMAQKLANADDVPHVPRDAFSEACEALPELAMRHYYAQYLDLMLSSRDFFTWAFAYEHAKTQSLVVDEAAALDERLSRVLAAVDGVDVGLRRLAAALEGGRADDGPEADVWAALALLYERQAAEPIIVDPFVPGPGEPTLRYPARIDAFIPQAYRELRYPGTRVSLEDERLWADLPYRDDVAAAVVRALDSPYSVQAPVLVLGHPGSGKSLLTQVLAARLSDGGYCVVRLKLRDAAPGTPVQNQIEHQIRVDSGETVSWPALARGRGDRPVLVILDGYDELLQANGQVFADYLQQVHALQARELALERPVRVLITSRITLIDKAVVPPGTPVLRLAEFNLPRQQTWTRQWNALNAGYFERAGVRPFAPPTGPQLGDLAAQPLLLLLLAIYDSHANQLGHADIDRTSLYFSLLCRFVERELTKGEAAAAAHGCLSEADRRAAVELELDRLGLAALGMFNRRAVHISRADLGRDLVYHQVRRRVEGGTLSPADAVLGSFFFIHESRSRSGDPDDSTRGELASFEFLHNTFGEFLTADVILRRIIMLAARTDAYRGSPLLAGDLDAILSDPGDEWYGALAFEAVHHRPLVAQMLREWLPHRLAISPPTDFPAALHAVVTRQLALVLHAAPPRWFTDGADEAPYLAPPMLGGLAVYSLNLVVVAAMLGRIEVSDLAADDATSDWARLTSLWRSWFPAKSLLGLVSVVRATRSGDAVVFQPTADVEPVNVGALYSRIHESAVIADGLADHLIAGPATFMVGRAVTDGGLPLLKRGLDLLEQAGFSIDSEQIALEMRQGDPLPELRFVHLNQAGADACAAAKDRELPPSGPPMSAAAFTDLLPADADALIAVEAATNAGWLPAILTDSGEREDALRSPIAASLLRAARRQRASVPLQDVELEGSFEAAVEYALISVLLDREVPAADALLAERVGGADGLARLPEESWVALLAAFDRLPHTAAAVLEAVRQPVGDRQVLTRLVLDAEAWAEGDQAVQAATRASAAVVGALLRAARRYGLAGRFLYLVDASRHPELYVRRRLGLPPEPSASDPDVLGDLAWLLGESAT
ncbi:NACHT domain-containing protein [Dactylosporangium sp. NPDC051541]|uniref:NACHT domain-containing protein n=1 Tax=Dactylosporangium sp. NPDC051541 TaxID=3363977 RepID=UPI00379409A9